MTATSVACGGGDGAACSSTGCMPRRCQTACRSTRCQAAMPARPPSSTTSHMVRRRPLRRGWGDMGGVVVARRSPWWTACTPSAMVPSPLYTTPTVVVHWHAHLVTGSMQEGLLWQKALQDTSDETRNFTRRQLPYETRGP